MKQWHKSAAYREALKTLLIPIFLSTEQAMEWGSHLNAKQHTTLTQTQCALSNAARSECNTERKLNLAMQSQLMREAGQAFCASVIPLGIQGRSHALDSAIVRIVDAVIELATRKIDGRALWPCCVLTSANQNLGSHQLLKNLPDRSPT